MTWFLKLAVSNPWAVLAIAVAIFAAGATTGGGTAWWIQGLRVTSAQQDTKEIKASFDKYVLDQQVLDFRNREAAFTQREKQEKDYADLSKALDKEITDGQVYRRCVAAGRCGVRNDPMPPGSGNGLSTAGLTHEGSADAVSPGAGAAAPSEEGDQCRAIADDCAVTTLMLNRLQIGIESQPGYPKP